jgi:hypothetical protein
LHCTCSTDSIPWVVLKGKKATSVPYACGSNFDTFFNSQQQGRSRRIARSTPGMQPRTNDTPLCGRLGSAGLKAVRPNSQFGQPLVSPSGPLLWPLADMWALGCIPFECNILRWFGHLVGPWILVTSMWCILIRRGFPPLD